MKSDRVRKSNAEWRWTWRVSWKFVRDKRKHSHWKWDVVHLADYFEDISNFSFVTWSLFQWRIQAFVSSQQTWWTLRLNKMSDSLQDSMQWLQSCFVFDWIFLLNCKWSSSSCIAIAKCVRQINDLLIHLQSCSKVWHFQSSNIHVQIQDLARLHLLSHIFSFSTYE